MTKFKVGDKVKIIQRKINNRTGECAGWDIADGNVGDVGIITYYSEPVRPYYVSQLSTGKYIGSFDEDDLELCQEESDTTKLIYVKSIKSYHEFFKVGEIYKRDPITKDVFYNKNHEIGYCSAFRDYFFKHFEPSTEEAYLAQFETKSDSDTLPKKWCFKVTPENYEEFKHLRKLSQPVYGYILSQSFGKLSWGYWEMHKPLSYTEISFETFRKHFLTKETTKKFSMKEVQEECKKRFPIGCQYISASDDDYFGIRTLSEDYVTYTIHSNMIYAHDCGGLLYNKGKWAEKVEHAPHTEQLWHEDPIIEERQFPSEIKKKPLIEDVHSIDVKLRTKKKKFKF